MLKTKPNRKLKTFKSEQIIEAPLEVDTDTMQQFAEIVRDIKMLSGELSGSLATKHLADIAARACKRLEEITADDRFCVWGLVRYRTY